MPTGARLKGDTLKLEVYVFIYNNVKIYRVGRIIFHCPLKPGLLKIGYADLKSQGVTKFFNAGTIELYDSASIGGASIVENLGLIILKGMNYISDGCYIFIRKKSPAASAR